MNRDAGQMPALARLAARGQMSRRGFMQRALAAGLTLGAADALLATAARAEPKRGGTLRLGLAVGATTDSMDPGLYPDQFTGVALWGTLSNSLTEIDSHGNAVPDLAESFEPANGARTWVFRLRKGVTFHNGKTVTADDVVASFRHHMLKDTKSAAKPLLSAVTAVKADGAGTVVFELAGGNADFPYIASDYHIPIMPAKPDGSADWEGGVRTGPYVLEKFQPGVQAAFTRNADYFKADRAWFERVECLSIKDVTARMNALNAGEIDYLQRADLKTVDLLKQNPAIAINELTGYGHYIYAMNVTAKPFDHPDVRNAIKYSVPREEILEKVFMGHGTLGNDNPIAPAVKFAADPQPRHGYDVAMAKSLLKKAGLETLAFDLSVAEAAFTGATDAALVWKERAKAAGIDINVIREPEDAYWDNVWMKKPFVAGSWGGRPTCDWMFSAVYAGDATWNETYWKNPRFNELLLAARSETDEARRAAMYGEMQQLVHDDGGLVNLVFNSYVDAHVNTLAHGEQAANWPMDGLKIAERWWFA